MLRPFNAGGNINRARARLRIRVCRVESTALLINELWTRKSKNLESKLRGSSYGGKISDGMALRGK